MVFDKQVRRVCAHCQEGKDFSFSHNLCPRYGPVSPDYTCSHFKYDPLRRHPPKPARIILPQSKNAFDL